jgi:hypothetical protein
MAARLTIAEAMPNPQRRYVFVCGLHRSGTTLVARALASHPLASGFAHTGAIEDEGQFLQAVFPVENTFGGVGRFGFDPRAHMTEASALNAEPTSGRLKAEWHRHWDLAKPVLVEKTPSNLLRMRLLERMLGPAYFVVVTRHPIASALATMKWTEGNLFSLLCHWTHCHRIAREDSACVGRVLWISYERLIANPKAQLGRIALFLGLEPEFAAIPSFDDRNRAYFAAWRSHYCGDLDRSIAQKPPERRRSLITRMRERMALERSERTLPEYRRRAKLRDFHDALDAIALLEPTVTEFGYSLVDLDRIPDA